MTKWIIKKINNKYSDYDFRLVNKENDYSLIDFSKYSILRILVSLSSYLTDGVFYKDKEYFKITFDSKKPAIFNFSISKSVAKKKYLILNNKLTDLVLIENGESINLKMLTTYESTVYSNLFIFDKVINVQDYIEYNKEAYEHLNFHKNQRYITTGWLNTTPSNYLILDLLKLVGKTKNLTRCIIQDKNILNQINTKQKINSYCIFIISITSNFEMNLKVSIETILPITFDEYLTYIYDLMIPYKYDFNDYFKGKLNYKKYHDYDIERNAFAIDPVGSKDRDDAISCFYLFNGKITNDFKSATHIKLKVHISDTFSYIYPSNNNYYYNYSKYKCNTDYLDKYNLPMMDRILSEDYLSLDGNNKKALTINLVYKIINVNKFLIEPIVDKVYLELSSNLNIIGTTYNDFATSFNLKPEKFFSNNEFLERKIIPCREKLIRDYNEFIHQGKSSYKDTKLNTLANNLKQLYIFFVNSLDHTGKDSLIKIPNNLTRDKIDGKKNLFLDFTPIDMWAHSLVEYTALESNIYFSYFMFTKENRYYLSKFDIIKIVETLGNKNINLLLDNIIDDKKVKGKKIGIFRNLYNPNLKLDLFINNKIKEIILKIWSKLNKKSNRKNLYQVLVKNLLLKYGFKISNNSEFSNLFLKMILALRQTLLLININSNLDVTLNLISKDLKMKAAYSYFPFSHYDICTFLYTHATSPMRRFVDINVHNLIFNFSRKNYIFRHFDMDRINSSFNTNKYIKQIVNENRFLEFIKYNSKDKDLILEYTIIEENPLAIGFPDINNFFKFVNFSNKDKRFVKLELNPYNLPELIPTNKNKTFNIYKHMLSREDIKLQSYCKDFLKKILKIKNISNVCDK